MMGHTDRHFRFMANLLAKDIKLYTPMIHADTIVFSENQLLETETESANLRYTENITMMRSILILVAQAKEFKIVK